MHTYFRVIAGKHINGIEDSRKELRADRNLV